MSKHCAPTCDAECDDYDHECHSYCNAYNNPEKHGFRILEAFWEKGLSYHYNAVILFEDVKTNQKYFASDSGCSCPRPFENYKSVKDMTPLRGHAEEYKRRVQSVRGWSKYI